MRPVYSLPSMISLNAAYGINESNINASNDSISALIDRRETLESNLDYFSFGIAYKKFINQKIFFSLGLNYGQYTSSFQYQDYTFISGSRVDTTEIIIYNDGMMEFVSEEVPFVTTQITQNVNYLKYKTLQIPIGLGLNVNLNDQYNFEIESGLSYNFISMNSGRIVSNESDFSLLSELSENYKSSNLWSAYAGFSIHRQLSNHWRIGLGLNANFDLSNRVNNEAGYSHKFRSYAGQLSISRIF